MKNVTLIFLMLVSFFAFSACSDDDDNDQIVQLTIASERGIGYVFGEAIPVLLVREGNSKDWNAFYNEIEGFEFKAGSETVLEVRKVRIMNPPQDSSDARYILIKIISSEEKYSENLQE